MHNNTPENVELNVPLLMKTPAPSVWTVPEITRVYNAQISDTHRQQVKKKKKKNKQIDKNKHPYTAWIVAHTNIHRPIHSHTHRYMPIHLHIMLYILFIPSLLDIHLHRARMTMEAV